MDIIQFVKVSVVGIPLIVVIFAIVGALKRAGIKGKKLLLFSFLNGLFWGCGYQVLVLQPPQISAGVWVLFGYWFGVLAYGVTMGGIASLCYDAGKDMLMRMVTQAIAEMLKPIRASVFLDTKMAMSTVHADEIRKAWGPETQSEEVAPTPPPG